MTVTTCKTFEILGHEFELDQLNDIVNHGMASGVSGFIYSSDLYDIYEANEDSILEYLDERASDMGDQSGVQMVINVYTKRDPDAFYTMQNIKETAVWMFVEMKAYDLLCEAGHPDYV